jgi:predicted short-subunit dehydrogenase-like oxidoreductase (DUF2520 family)
VATHLGRALYAAGHTIMQVYSRTSESAVVLASEVNAQPSIKLHEINTVADLYIIAVKDDSMAEIIDRLHVAKGMVAHTSGSMDMTVLSKFINYGVLYPLQTLSRNKQIDFKAVPLCVEANTSDNEFVLNTLSISISDKVIKVNSQQRMSLHIAAVFTTNFTHHLFVIAAKVLTREGLDFIVMKPLLEEAFNKAMQSGQLLKVLQTGPAVRGDKTIIDKHLQQLDYDSMYQSVYRLLSESIMKTASN